jgi:sarcosine oxidase subunit alpha
MSARVTVLINGVALECTDDLSVAAALFNGGVTRFRADARGYPRAPLCGMGTCFECRVTIDGVADTRACLEPVRDGMQIGTAP